MAGVTMAQAINQALAEALDADPEVMLLGQDIGVSGGVFRVTAGLQERFGEDRVVDTPLAESGIVGSAIGLALGGARPIAEIQFMGFSYPAFDQIISQASRFRNRSRGRFTIPLVIRMPYGGGFGAAEHHSESTEALYAHIPGLKVVVPATAEDAYGLLLEAIADPDPVVFLEPIRLYRRSRSTRPLRGKAEIGTAARVREGDDLTIVAWGAVLADCMDTVDDLVREGISVDLIDLRTVSPWDADTVVSSVRRTGRLLVVHEAPRTAGFGAEIVATVQREALYQLLTPIERLTGWDTVVPLRRSETYYMPTPERIALRAREMVAG